MPALLESLSTVCRLPSLQNEVLPVEWIQSTATLCGYLSVIIALGGTLWKLSRPLKEIVQRLDRMEQYQHNDYMSTLRLTIMSEEMPMEERLAAGEKYVNEGGNGAVKARYHLMIEEYQREIGKEITHEN